MRYLRNIHNMSILQELSAYKENRQKQGLPANSITLTPDQEQRLRAWCQEMDSFMVPVISPAMEPGVFEDRMILGMRF